MRGYLHCAGAARAPITSSRRESTPRPWSNTKGVARRARAIAIDLAIVNRAFVGRLHAPAEFQGARPTVRRLVNLWRVTWECKRFRTSLHSYPLRLCIEASAACNLSCPHCFTGAGERSRERATLTPEFFTQLLDEMGAYLWQ